MILAIDPGCELSAYCLMTRDTYRPLERGKVGNGQLAGFLMRSEEVEQVAIEMIASYGMPVGREVFETCVWIGRFMECTKAPSQFVYRKDVKLNLCNSTRAKDSNVRQALIDRFGVVGTKKSPGWFYGFKADMWSAYAVGVTYLDSLKGATR